MTHGENVQQVPLASVLEENSIQIDPQLVANVNTVTARTFIDLLHLPEDEIDARMEAYAIQLGRIRSGEIGGTSAVVSFLHYDALHHIGTMMHASFLMEDPSPLINNSSESVPDRVLPQLQNAINFHFKAATAALDGFITKEPQQIVEYLEGSINHLQGQLNEGNLNEQFAVEVQKELDIYMLLRSQLPMTS